MKILIVNSSGSGGAYMAAKRLYQNYHSKDATSVEFCAGTTKTENFFSSFLPKLYKKIVKFFELILLREPIKKNVPFNLGLMNYSTLLYRKNFKTADVFNLHWLGEGFISLEALAKFNKPIVITMHDSWFFTGGCHLPGTCIQYSTGCEDCPLFETKHAKRVVRKTFQKKKEFYKNNRVHFISPSRWLAQQFANSSIYDEPFHSRILNCVGEAWHTVALKDQKLSCAAFISLNPFYDINKNFKLTLKICDALNEFVELKLLVVGGAQIPTWAKRNYLSLIPTQSNEKSMIEILSKCKYIFCTSKVENLPNVIIEGAFVGTKAVCTQVGGIPELSELFEEMILIDEGDIGSVIKKLRYEIENTMHDKKISLKLQHKARKAFNTEQILKDYSAVFHKLINYDN